MESDRTEVVAQITQIFLWAGTSDNNNLNRRSFCALVGRGCAELCNRMITAVYVYSPFPKRVTKIRGVKGFAIINFALFFFPPFMTQTWRLKTFYVRQTPRCLSLSGPPHRGSPHVN